jgi:hypothetical protein
MSTAAGTIESVAIELSKLLEPLQAQLATPGGAKVFLTEMGFILTDPQVAALSGPLSVAASGAGDLVQIITALIAAIDAEDFGTIVAKGLEAIQRIGQIVDALASLGNQLSGVVGVPAADVAKRLFDTLAYNYLEATPEVNDALEMVGLLERDDHNQDSTDPNNPPFTVVNYRFDQIGPWFSDAAGQIKALYDWGNGFDGRKLFSRAERIIARIGLPVIYDDTGPKLDIVFLEAVPKTDVNPHGLSIRFKSNTASAASTLQLGTDASVDLKIDFPIPSGMRLDILPSGTVSFVPPAPGALSGDVQAKVTVERTAPPEPFILFGQAGASRLEMGKVTLSTGTTVAADATGAHGDFMLEADVDNLKVVIDTSDGDGFVGTILSGVHVDADFSVKVGVSTATGFYFSGSSALEVQLPVHIDLGPVGLNALTLEAKLDAGKIPTSIGADLSANLGPLQAVVQNMGVTATFSFPPGNSGNLGPLDFAIGFKPPNGVGLSIDAGVVQGGGFLSIDTDRGQYAGVLQLVIADFLGVTAIGLIETKMPDGSSGFSLLIIITADFGPGIQLGFGFTLNAVGGLLGLNRGMLFQPIMDGVRTNAISSVMFPQDVIANAPRIISDLQAFFPAQEGTFLIGPMAKLGWGEPTLVSLSLGVIIEIPPGDIAILGILKLALPADELAILVLQVNFAGAIEVDKQRIYFFAALFDSHVLFITIDGSMGLLFAWGDNANFVVSVGGFHPSFDPPPLPFPVPQRISVNIINEDYARIHCDGYFAVTTNTVQFGTHSDYFFGFSALSVEGDSGFDALIQFSPFHFTVSISTSFSVHVFGAGVFSVGISLTLEGPTPWHANGTASISLLFFSIGVNIDFTWGDSRDTTLPPVAVMPLIAAEFAKQSNWRALLPPGSNLLVSLRQLDPSEAGQVLHPVGTLRISQRLVPLDLTLDKFGNQQPTDANRFALSAASPGFAKTQDLQEQFAPAQFKNMDDATKLSQPSYVPMDGGIELGVSGISYASATAITRIVRYNVKIVDTRLRFSRIRFYLLAGGLFQHLLRGASVARSPLSAWRKGQVKPYADAVVVSPETFAVALASNNTAFHPDASAFTSQAAANDYLARAVADKPELAGTLHVLPQFEMAA